MAMMTKSRLKQKKQNLKKVKKLVVFLVNDTTLNLIKPTLVLKSRILPNSTFIFVPKRSYPKDTIQKNNKIQPLTSRY
jgi:hypothetical protein